MSYETAEIWTRIRNQLRLAVTDELTYGVWLADLASGGFEDGVLVIDAPPHVAKGIGRFRTVIDGAVTAVLGRDATWRLAGEEIVARSRAPASAAHTSPPGAEREDLNPKFAFEHFVLGDGNRFAHAAALAVAEMPAQAYNPLFVYGPPGVGKTHLLHSIGNYVRAYSTPALNVRYATAEAFTNAFTAALHGGDIDAFKARFRNVDVLLVDDVQFLESKAKTEQEFFHTFNALIDAGGQVVLTSDRQPRDLQALEDRLRERFESGLVADIQPPDLATRMTVLRKRAHHDGIAVADETALEAIANRITSNVRALEGALIRVVAFHSLTGRPITAELADEVLGGLYPEEPGGRAPRRPTVERVQHETCALFGLTLDELLSAQRTARVAWPRQVAMYLAREHTGESLPAIGSAFGGRNHTTVLHACKRAAKRQADDPEARETIRTLSERLHADRAD